MKPNEKHLEFLQNNIARMNQCSFQMKGWAITLASALIAVFVSTISKENPGNKIYIYAAIASTILFWCLDSLYLSKERKFIGVYNDLIGVTNGKNHKPVKIKVDGLESVWRWGKETATAKISELVAYRGKDNEIRIFQKERKLTQTAKTIWDGKEFISQKGTKEIQAILGKGKFDFLSDLCEVVYLPRTPEISTTKIKQDLK